MVDEDRPVILFDGVCNLCNGFFQFVVERDTAEVFRFATLQSDSGEELCEEYDVSEETDSIILIQNGRAYTKSGAVLHIVSQLGGFWPFTKVFLVVPGFLRDLVYDFVAGNRYDWFGKRDVCMTPTEDIKSRFLD